MLVIGLVLFPDLTQLDLTGPYEVFSRMPDSRVLLLAETLDAVRSEHGLTLMPDATWEGAPALDVLVVPGGVGVNAMMEHAAMMRFLHRQVRSVRFLTAVCTGALVLGAAGLLRGYRATTHWLSLDVLRVFGAEPVDARVVVDRGRITGGGVTAGIDFGLEVVALLRGAAVAQEVQLMLEYQPQPPFQSGSPAVAAASLVAQVRADRAGAQAMRHAIAQRVVAGWGSDGGALADG